MMLSPNSMLYCRLLDDLFVIFKCVFVASSLSVSLPEVCEFFLRERNMSFLASGLCHSILNAMLERIRTHTDVNTNFNFFLNIFLDQIIRNFFYILEFVKSNKIPSSKKPQMPEDGHDFNGSNISCGFFKCG